MLTSFASAQPAPAGEYHVDKTIKVDGAGHWAYLAVSPDHMLFVTRSTHEQIVDPAAGKVVADVDGGTGLHGTAIVPAAGRAFITDGHDAKILFVDLQTNTLLGKIDAADDADGVIYDAGANRVLVRCGDANQLLVLDPKAYIAKAKVEKVDLDGKPEFLAADGKGHAFVCPNDKNLVAEVDLKTLTVMNRCTGTAPAGLALDVKNGRLFVGCRNQKLIVMNSTDGKVIVELTRSRWPLCAAIVTPVINGAAEEG